MRRLVVVAILAAVELGGSAGAAPQPQLTDPKGDYPLAGGDLVSALFVTENKTKLVVTLEFAGPVDTPIPSGYQLRFSIGGGCIWRGHYYGAYGGSEASSQDGCAGPEANRPTVTAHGNTVVFTLAAKGALKPGTVLTGITAVTNPGGVTAGGGGDHGQTSKTYVVGT